MNLLYKRGRVFVFSGIGLVLFLLNGFYASAQHVSLSTNAVQWANLGTVNANVGVSVSRHFSIEAGARYNPFAFHKPSGLMIQNKQTTAYAGMRWWPWYVFSGWWISGKAQYSKFSDTGLWRYALNEGTGVGLVLSAGYTLMVSKRVNLEFGIGGWGGRNLKHTLYHCPLCMEIRESGPRNFISIDDVSVSFMYMF